MAVGKDDDAKFFSRIQASEAADKDVIRDKALEVFGSFFDSLRRDHHVGDGAVRRGAAGAGAAAVARGGAGPGDAPGSRRVGGAVAGGGGRVGLQ